MIVGNNTVNEYRYLHQMNLASDCGKRIMCFGRSFALVDLGIQLIVSLLNSIKKIYTYLTFSTSKIIYKVF